MLFLVVRMSSFKGLPETVFILYSKFVPNVFINKLICFNKFYGASISDFLKLFDQLKY